MGRHRDAKTWQAEIPGEGAKHAGRHASAEQAAEEAKKQFAELEGIRDWKTHAALIEVEPVDFET